MKTDKFNLVIEAKEYGIRGIRVNLTLEDLFLVMDLLCEQGYEEQLMRNHEELW